jgi:hypothetical protein
MDKLTPILVEAIKQAVGQTGEQRLFRSTKLPGIFAGRTGSHGDAAAQALRDGLLEITRTETKGKTTTEWVRVTPRGIEFVHQSESPVQALHDLRAVLTMTQQGIPVWVSDLRQELQTLSDRLTEQVQRITQRIEALSQRVTEALERAEAAQPSVPVDLADTIPWAAKVLYYLDQRKTAGMVNACTLAELFAALREKQPELTVTEYHSGLRRLHERGVVRLSPHEGEGALPEPEYALLDGSATFYHISRT